MIFEHLFLHTYHNIIREIKFKNYENEWSTNTQAKLSTMKYYRISRPIVIVAVLTVSWQLSNTLYSYILLI